jgi:hypothetical protein
VARLVTPELDVLVSPARAYREYVRRAAPAGFAAALGRPLLVALVQGVAISMAATQSVAAPLVASVTAYWSISVLVQLLAALVLIRPAVARGSLPVTRALDLFFLGHAPWSLWLLLSAGVMAFAPSVWWLRWIALAGMIVPVVLTARIVAAFGEVVLGYTRRDSIRRTIVHQGLTVGLFVVYIATGIQLWPRVAGLFG